MSKAKSPKPPRAPKALLVPVKRKKALRSVHLTITLTIDERRTIDRVAKRNGNTSSSWGRLILLREAEEAERLVRE